MCTQVPCQLWRGGGKLEDGDKPLGNVVEARSAHEVDVGDDPIGLGREGILARVAGCDALVTLVTDRGLLSRERIARLKPGAVVVSTSRGACLDEIALAEALRDGRVAAAGLDVFAREPEVPAALLACENAVLTPHLGSAGRPTREAMARICADAVLAVLAGDELPGGVSRSEEATTRQEPRNSQGGGETGRREKDLFRPPRLPASL